MEIIKSIIDSNDASSWDWSQSQESGQDLL